MLASGLGAAITDTIFNPLEMLKVRVQTSETTFPAAARSIYAQGGPWLLWTPGLQATWVRSFCVTGLRVGLYPSVKRAVSGDAPTTSFATKFAVGAATGALSASLANPIDMVRTRVHAQVGLPTRYASTAAAVLSIVQSRMMPPDEPSRDMACATAAWVEARAGSLSDEGADACASGTRGGRGGARGAHRSAQTSGSPLWTCPPCTTRRRGRRCTSSPSRRS